MSSALLMMASQKARRAAIKKAARLVRSGFPFARATPADKMRPVRPFDPNQTFVAGDPGYGPLASADEALYGEAFRGRPNEDRIEWP